MSSSIAWSTRLGVLALGAVVVFAVLGTVTFEVLESRSPLAIAGFAIGAIIMLGAMVVGWHRNKTLITTGFADQLSSERLGGPGFGGGVHE